MGWCWFVEYVVDGARREREVLQQKKSRGQGSIWRKKNSHDRVMNEKRRLRMSKIKRRQIDKVRNQNNFCDPEPAVDP